METAHKTTLGTFTGVAVTGGSLPVIEGRLAETNQLLMLRMEGLPPCLPVLREYASNKVVARGNDVPDCFMALLPDLWECGQRWGTTGNTEPRESAVKVVSCEDFHMLRSGDLT